MKEIELKLTTEETNVILEGLGNLPFARVYALVAKIQAQASEQIKAHGTGGTAARGGDANPKGHAE
jgi:hypothetical protein